MSGAKQDAHWTRPDERRWLTTLTGEQLDGYARGLARRVVDFETQPVTRQFREDCALDLHRARTLDLSGDAVPGAP